VCLFWGGGLRKASRHTHSTTSLTTLLLPYPLSAESSATWREYQEVRAAEKEIRIQDAQAQAVRQALKEAAEAGETGAEAEERGKAAAAAAAAAFKTGKAKVKKSGGAGNA
jgi:hypothetical protein